MVLLSGCVCCLVAGCGAKPYKRGLQRTVDFWAYLEKLDHHLSREWQGAGGAIKLRVPKQFKLIPAPQPELDKESKEEGKLVPVPPERDPRQPRYLRVILPGLEGAWQTTLEVVVGEQAKQAPAYMYVLSNRERFQDPDLAKTAMNFHTDVVTLLTDALKVPFPDPDQWEEKRYPPTDGYVEEKLFNLLTLKPQQQINGAPTDVLIYQYKLETTWVVVLFVIPQGYDSRQKLPERIALCLETLKVSGRKPGKFGPSKAKRPGF